MATEFLARKCPAHPADAPGFVSYNLYRNGYFFGAIDTGRDNELCFRDLDDEKRGYRVRALLTRRLGRNKALRDMLAILREEYK